MAQSEEEEKEGITATTRDQLTEFANNVTKQSIERLSTEGQLRQALISLERYIDEDQQLLTQKEMIIPKFALSKAKGIVFLSLIKCGFVFAGCIGTGCIIVKTNENNNIWSGPSSIACAGLSVGLLAGASKVDYIMILPNKMAVESFMSSGQLRIGGNLSFTLLKGRDAESNIGKGDIGPISVIYSYSHSKGIYGGISLHGKLLSVRNDCNKKFYGHSVTNKEILSGHVMPSFINNDYQQIIHILNSYCYDPNGDGSGHKYDINNLSIHKKEDEILKCVEACSCKLCQQNKGNMIRSKSMSDINVNNKNLIQFDKTNPFNIDNNKIPQKQNKSKSHHRSYSVSTNPFMTVNRIEIKPKLPIKTSKTRISIEKLMEATPPPPACIDNDKTYKYNDPKFVIDGDKVELKLDDPWSNPSKEESKVNDNNINMDPYALAINPFDKLIETKATTTNKNSQIDKFDAVIKKVKETVNEKETNFQIDSDDDNKDDKKKKKKKKKKKDKKNEHRPYIKPTADPRHYSDYEVTKYSLENYDKNGCRINTFSLLFQIDNICYETSIRIGGKLVSKQYIVNWPKKCDCKAVIIVTSKIMSSYYSECNEYDPYQQNNNNDNYELRLIIYDERDDDLIVYDINIKFSNIKQIVNTINGAFIISPNKPWTVLESIFKSYNHKMYESMIDISTSFNDDNILKYGDLIRVNFGSLCKYGIYIGLNDDGDKEIICFKRRFPNNGSSAFKKLRLFMVLFNGKATKKIKIEYMTLSEFIFDCGRIEVIYYPIPCISPINIVRKGLIATNNNIKNCICEYSPKVESRLTLSTKEIIQDGVLNVIDGITATVNTVVEAVSLEP